MTVPLTLGGQEIDRQIDELDRQVLFASVLFALLGASLGYWMAERIADPGLSRWIAVCKSGRYTVHRPLTLGAAIAGRLDLAPAFERYGTALGEAFQLRDDLIDAFGDSTVSGADHTDEEGQDA